MSPQPTSRSQQLGTFGEDETLPLGECIARLTLLVRGYCPIPPRIADASFFVTAFTPTPSDARLLGEGIRDILASTPYSYRPSIEEGKLFWEACRDAAETLRSSIRSRASLVAMGIYDRAGFEPSAPPPVQMEDLAQRAIDRAFTDSLGRGPSAEGKAARVSFVLLLDARNADAYYIKGTLAEKARQYQEARDAFEQAMKIAGENLGPEWFAQDRKANDDSHSWRERDTESYLKARASLAWLLWRDVGRLPEAVRHYRGVVELNAICYLPNISLFLCALAEQGDTSELSDALIRYHYWPDGVTGEPINVAGTIWHYTNALCLFMTHQTTTELNKALAALRQAFKINPYVPLLLMEPDGLPAFDNLGFNARGDATEATWYALVAHMAWKKVPGALEWLYTAGMREGGIFAGEGQKAREVIVEVLHEEAAPDHPNDTGISSPGAWEIPEEPSRHWRGPCLTTGLSIIWPLGVDSLGRRLLQVPSIPLAALDQREYLSDSELLLELPGIPGSLRPAQLMSAIFFTAPDQQGVVQIWPTEFTVQFKFQQEGVIDLWQHFTLNYWPRTGQPALLLQVSRGALTDPAVSSVHPDAMATTFGQSGYLRNFRPEYPGRGDHYWIVEDPLYKMTEYGSPLTRHQHLTREMLACLQETVNSTLPHLEIFCDRCSSARQRSGLSYCQHVYWCVTCRRLSVPLTRMRKYTAAMPYHCFHQQRHVW